MNNYIIAIGLILTSCTIMAQSDSDKFQYINKVIEADENFDRYEDYYYSSRKEIGLDFTSLIDRFVPFNFTNPDQGLVGIKFKKYGRATAFRMAFGASVTNDFNNPFLFISLGYEKRNQIHKKWTYTKGWEIYAFGDSRNSRDSSGLGFSRFYGIEYNLNENMFLSTEAALRFGTEEGSPAISFVVPNFLFFNVRF